MQLRSGTGSMTAVLMALAALATACGGGGSGPTGEKPPTGDKPAAGATAGTGADSGKPKGGTVDFDTVFKTEERFRQALPDPESMKGWKPKTGRANVEEQPKSAAECGPDAHWDCTRIANGSVKFEAFGETAYFDIQAYADKPAAGAACAREKDWSATYGKAEVTPVPGVEGHAYYRNAGSLDGLDLIMCLGTVIAKVRLEDGGGSSLDPATVHNLARLFVPRIQKAAASS
ncbi:MULTISPECIES: hypothetical protein [unclassified Streptomyces]|uniref:hypothetical protein n=1 Tax=unclassified Streptomyces TaxID=2593676 RepID=UPI002885467B|nr:hypothetical protein [Streptomyces sp. DSM 41633]